MTRAKLLPLVALATAALLTGCPRPSGGGQVRPDGDTDGQGPQFPTRPTVEVKRNPEADEALARAAGVEDPEAKAEAFLAVRKAYPESTAGQEALYRAGVIYFETEQYALARRSFNELLFENPLFDRAQDAKLKLGLSALEIGAYRDAFHTLLSLADRARGDERRELLLAAERAAEGAHLFGDALKLSIRLAEEASSVPEQQAALARIESLIEGKVGFIDIAAVAEDLPATNPAWPLVTFKLARIFFHLRDFNRLQETLNRFLQNAPSHPFAAQAEELLARSNRLVQAKPNVVGVILPMTGRYQPTGEAVMRGLRLALEGSNIELVVKDSQGDANIAGRAVEELAFDDQVIAIIGPLLGDDSRRAALGAEELQVPILTLSRSEGITEIGPFVFRNMLTTSAQSEALAQYGTEVMGFKKFALLYPSIPYGVELANSFWDEVNQRGGEVRGAESYGFDQTTFSGEAKKLVGRYYLDDRSDYVSGHREIMQGPGDAFRKRKAVEALKSKLDPVIDFEAILIPDDWRRVGLVAPALAVEDIVTNACDPKDLERIRKTTGRKDLQTVTLLGTNQWSSPKGRSGLPELIERGGKFVMCSVYVDGFFADSNRKATRRFVDLYRERHADLGRDPGLLEAIGYDSAGMIRSVIDQQKPQTRLQFRRSLADLKDFDGATGKTHFSEEREAKKPLFLLTITSKGVRELGPTEKIEGS
ncbi:MAG: penicillin-binding protein activator [Myxococcota bacterium]|nr:penicillin-binding protein activator [Myxococcota bacterium]